MLTARTGGVSVPAMKGRAFITGWKRAAITAVLAYALALQALLTSLGGALHAGEAHWPQAIICEAGAQSPSNPAPAEAHDVLCCVLSCHGSASSAGPAPVGASVARPVRVAAAGVPYPDTSFPRPASDILPVGSRAPPRLG